MQVVRQVFEQVTLHWVDDFGILVAVDSLDRVLFRDCSGVWRLQPLQSTGGALAWHSMLRALGRQSGTMQVWSEVQAEH